MTVAVESLNAHRNALWCVLLLAIFALAAGIGLREPSPPDEPRFALAAQHMVLSGDWLLPKRGSELYAEKPPVFMWLIAASQVVVRDSRIAFLLPSLLAALATLWLVADLTTRLWGRRYAAYAAGALFVCLQFGLQAKRAQIDMVLVCLTTLSLWGMLRHLLRGPDWRAAWIGAFAAGVGTVTKGVGFLPLLVLLPWAFSRAPRVATATAHATSAWRWAIFSLAFIAGTMVWLGPLLIALLRDDDPALRAYAAELLLRQTADRYANAWHHVQPVWYYLQSIATLWLPGALLLPWLLPAWWRRLRRGDPRLLLLLGWAVLVLIFFSASPGKREVYIFPILPALCVAAAPLLPALLKRRAVRMTLFVYLLVLSGALALLSASALLGASDWAQKLASQRALSAAVLHSVLSGVLLLGLGGLLLAAGLRTRKVAIAILLFTAALWSMYGVVFSPAIDASSSARSLMRKVGEHLGPSAELGLVAWREQHLLQADRPVADFGFKQAVHVQWRDAAKWVALAPAKRWLFVEDQALSPCVDRSRVVAIGQSNRRSWLLVPGLALATDCVSPEFKSTAQVETGTQ